MNEWLFFIHILLLLIFIRSSLFFGKSALIAFCSLQTILANLFIAKEITLFSLPVTPTDAYTIGTFFTLNLIRERYGSEEAKKMIHLNLLFLLFFILMGTIQTRYIPTLNDTTHSSYVNILSIAPRIFIASTISFYLSQLLDNSLFFRARKLLSFPFAMLISLSLSQLFDTIFFTYIGLSGILTNLVSVIFFSYLIKLIAIGFLSAFSGSMKSEEMIR